MKGTNLIFSILVTLILSSVSCKKIKPSSDSNNTVWIRVLEDSLLSSTDNQSYQGINGKVITDQEDHIMLYYFSKNIIQTSFIYCNSDGRPLWRKKFSNFVPMDMKFLSNGNVIIVGYDSLNIAAGLKLYRIGKDQSLDSVSMLGPLIPVLPSGTLTHVFKTIFTATLIVMPDNSVRVSGAMIPTAYNINIPYFGKVNANFEHEWTRQINYLSDIPKLIPHQPLFSQHSMIPINDHQFLFQWAIDGNPTVTDSLSHGVSYGILNDGPMASLIPEWIDTINYINSGTENLLTSSYTGCIYRYANGFLKDFYGDYVYHFSAPRILGDNPPKVSAGFVKINAEAEITDTIPIPLPDGYKIVSFTQNDSRFLLTAYKTNILSGTNDYSAYHTLILSGGTDWQTSTFQQFYSDYFSSVAPMSDGSFIIMGRIQSFNGPSNKLILIKWKD